MADKVILKLLYLPILGARFEVADQEEGTFEWIFTDPDAVRENEPELKTTFPEWLKSGNGIFHICGKPGSGKSTLMRYICRHPDTKHLLAEWAGHDELLFAKFFFWRIGGAEQKSIHGLIRGLLHQILCKHPRLSRYLFSKETRERLVRNVQAYSGAQLESNEIFAAFSKLIETTASLSSGEDGRGTRICLFIDGLDEFDITKVNQSYRTLVTMLQEWSTNSNGHVKICVSSRIEAPFMGMFDKHKRFTLHKLTKNDIEHVIKENLESNPRFHIHQKKSPDKCQKLINSIMQSAEGVFLWVMLVLKDLGQNLDQFHSIDDLLRVISEKPRELDDLLEQIMSSITRIHRPGVEALLAALLRRTGVLLSESTGSEYIEFFEKVSSIYRSRTYGFSTLSAFFVLRATEKGISMLEDFTSNRILDAELDELAQDGISNLEAENAICKIVQERCNGVIDIVSDGHLNGQNWAAEVKFMHRSVPEFLRTYFSRCTTPGVHSDQRAMAVVAWAYLVDLKLMGAKSSQHPSLISFLRGKHRLGPGEGTESTKFYNIASYHTAAILSSHGFIPILRQVKHEEGSEDLFRLLVQITRALGDEMIDGRNRFLGICAYYGLHEFIGWLFRETDILANEDMWPGLLVEAANGAVYHTSRIPLEVMQTMFAHGADGRIVFSNSEQRHGLAGKPVWHYVLVKTMSRTLHLRAETSYNRKALIGEVIELWLTHGANPRVRFGLSADGAGGVEVSSAPDNSGCIADEDYYSADGDDIRDQFIFYSKRAVEFSLRDWVLVEKPHNESKLLDLLQDDTEDGIQGAQGPDNVEPDLPELSEEHGEDNSLPVHANQKIADKIEPTTPVASQWRGVWEIGEVQYLYIHLFFLGVLGLMIAYLI